MNDVLDISNSLAPKSRKLYVPGMVKVFIPALKRAIYILFLIKKNWQIKYLTWLDEVVLLVVS